MQTLYFLRTNLTYGFKSLLLGNTGYAPSFSLKERVGWVIFSRGNFSWKGGGTFPQISF